MERKLLSGDEAVAYAALHAQTTIAIGYPGTPSTQILETLNRLGGAAQWSPNEKVALEVGIGAAFAGKRALVTMKHVGLNVAADPLFSAAYTDVDGGLVIISGDDPGMASSQNEQDNRWFARAAGVPMLEPSDSQQAYQFTKLAFEISQRWMIPVIVRLTTRICHSKTIVELGATEFQVRQTDFQRKRKERAMLPGYGRIAHKRQLEKLKEIAIWNDIAGPINEIWNDDSQGIIATGISAMHAQEACRDASHLSFGLTFPLPENRIREFSKRVKRINVVEEGDDILVNDIRALGVPCEGKKPEYRLGELNVQRVNGILGQQEVREEKVDSAPTFCGMCWYREIFTALKELDLIVSGDIGCYSLGALPPFEVIDSIVCMGASIGVGLGMRHSLPEDEARRVISIIGDSTFVHSGMTGLAEMVYNKPSTGHIVLLLNNGTTAMTGHQGHPGSGKRLDGTSASPINYKQVAKGIGVEVVEIVEGQEMGKQIKKLIKKYSTSNQTVLIILQHSANRISFSTNCVG